MKILFAALHLAYYRNFESVVRALAERGHQVHLTADEPENLGGRELAERLAAEYATVTWGQLPSLEHEPWFDAARRMRESLDYVRVLDASYPDKLRFRTEERAARLVRGGTRVPGGAWLALRALKAFERALPVSQAIRDYLERERPDVVVLTSLTYSRSQQLDVLRAARSLGIPVAAAIMSWDHLSSKALLHVAPDLVIVWNEVQRQEAVEMHGLRAERIVVTGAQCYDQWFARTPDRDRETFCRAVGLRPDRPFVLWVHSALSPTPVPPEPVLVQRWIEALRASADPHLRDVGVLVRGHPERMKEWAGIDLTGYGNVAFSGGNPIDAERKQDYFDSLFYSSAVVGLVTTAFVEAAVVGRPVLTITLPEYRRHQEEMIHFRYLRTVAGGLLHSAPDLAGHLAQLADAIGTTGRDERNLRFVNAFVRPAGLDVPATPAFVAALEGASSLAAPAPVRAPWYQAAVVTVASWSGTAAGRWLMNDKRADAYDEHRDERERAVRTRVEAKSRWHAGKVRRNQWRGRRDAVVGAWKAVKRAGRLARHRAAVSVHRLLHVTRLRRLPGPVMRAIVLTSTMRRHCFVANTVSRLVDVVGVWQEAKSFQPLAYADTPDDAAVIERHFDARQASEDAFFADHETVHRAARRVPPGGCNHPAVLEAMRAARPGVVLVFGTGLLKRPLLDLFPDRVLNIHLGLSPYYRGAGTNFWPLVNGEPEYCGATIHFIDEGVDSGPIVEHVRPDIQAGDGPHEIGNKTIIAAAGALGRAAVALGRGPVASTPQGADGRVYRRADFSAAAVRRLYDRFERGMIADYLAHRAERDAALSLVTLEPL